MKIPYKYNCQLFRALIVAVFLLPVAFSCSRGRAPEEQRSPAAINREELVNVNRQLAAREADLIESYSRRRGWDVEKTGSGLRYQIYEKGSGERVKTGSRVEIAYTVSLLDGTVCYSSGSDGNKVFRPGQGEAEAGLEEGILLLRQGDKARLVIPSYLAHGLIGDQNRIPPRAIIVYELEVINVN